MSHSEQTCSNCFYARTDTFSRVSGMSGSPPILYESLACHFWPPEPTLGTWRQIKPTDWCGQWSSDGASKFGHALPGVDVVVPAPVVNVAAAAPVVVPAPTVNVAAAEVIVPTPLVNVEAAAPLVLPAPAVNVAAAQVTVPAPIVNVAAPQGEPASIAVGAVTTLPPGQAAAVRNVGTPGNAILEFDIPRGAQGNGPL